MRDRSGWWSVQTCADVLSITVNSSTWIEAWRIKEDLNIAIGRKLSSKPMLWTIHSQLVRLPIECEAR